MGPKTKTKEASTTETSNVSHEDTNNHTHAYDQKCSSVCVAKHSVNCEDSWRTGGGKHMDFRGFLLSKVESGCAEDAAEFTDSDWRLLKK